MRRLYHILSILILFIISVAPISAQNTGNCQVAAGLDSCLGEISPSSQWKVTVFVDMTNSPEPNDELAAFTASLIYDSTQIRLVEYFQHQSWSMGIVNVDTGIVKFNGVNVSGLNGKVNILDLTFKTIGPIGASGILDLEYKAMGAAKTFSNLLPVLCVSDCVYRIVENVPQKDE